MPADRFLEPKISVDAIDPFVVYGMAQTVKFGGDQTIAPGRMFKDQFLDKGPLAIGILVRGVI